MAEFTLRELKDMIPEYDGDQATLNDFIEACNFVTNQIEENQSEALIFIIKSKLVGKAKRFISSRNLRAWDEIRNLLIGHYGDCRDTEGLLRDLTSTFQKSSETPRAFVQRIEDLLTKIRSSVALDNTLNEDEKLALNSSYERIALKTFLSGLNDPFGSIIRSQKPESLDQAEQYLIEEENIAYLKNFRITKPAQKPIQNNKPFPKENYGNYSHQNRQFRTTQKFCTYCKKNGHLITECFTKNRNYSGNSNFHNNNLHRSEQFHQNTNSNHHNNPIIQQQRSFMIQRKPNFMQNNRQANHLNSQEEIDVSGQIDFPLPVPETTAQQMQDL